MYWFLAKIVYQIVCGDGNHAPQFDEQLRLIKAEGLEEALTKSECIGKQEEECFYNNKQQLVQWQFVCVADLQPLAELLDGAEVYSQIKEVDDATAYRSYLLHKASLLSKSCFSPSLQTV